MNTQEVTGKNPREEYLKKLGAVICPNAKQETFGAVEKKYERLTLNTFLLMYGLVLVGTLVMSKAVTAGLLVFVLGVLQFYLIMLFSELWYNKHYRYAVAQLNKDPEAVALIAEYSSEEWEPSKDIF